MSTATVPVCRSLAGLRGWLPLLLFPALVMGLTPAHWPRWVFMWLLAFAIYCGCKWLTWRRSPLSGQRLGRDLGYLLLWPGLDASFFLDPTPSPRQAPTRGEWLFAGGKLLLGLLFFTEGVRLVPADHPWLAGWVGMAGLIFLLHFGSFHLLSCAWRSAGVEARPLMNWPIRTQSVSEFWGQRWNTAFRDLTHQFLFRPLSRVLGPRWGLAAGFLFSGLVHDAVISFPAGGGYGFPTLFFVLQGAALVSEKSFFGRRLGLGRGWRGWLFALLVLLPAVVLLFTPPFVLNIIVPMLRDTGILPPTPM